MPLHVSFQRKSISNVLNMVQFEFCQSPHLSQSHLQWYDKIHANYSWLCSFKRFRVECETQHETQQPPATFNLLEKHQNGCQDTTKSRCWKGEVAQEVTEVSLALERQCRKNLSVLPAVVQQTFFGTGFQSGLVVLTSRLEKGLGSGLLRKISLR